MPEGAVTTQLAKQSHHLPGYQPPADMQHLLFLEVWCWPYPWQTWEPQEIAVSVSGCALGWNGSGSTLVPANSPPEQNKSLPAWSGEAPLQPWQETQHGVRTPPLDLAPCQSKRQERQLDRHRKGKLTASQSSLGQGAENRSWGGGVSKMKNHLRVNAPGPLVPLIFTFKAPIQR